MAECKFCFSEISDDNPVLVAEKIDAAGLDWDAFQVGRKITVRGVGVCEVVASKGYDGPMGYSEYELPQGTEFDAYVVVKFGEYFFRKDGVGDSYNSITWAGPVRPVKATAKQVTVYEF